MDLTKAGKPSTLKHHNSSHESAEFAGAGNQRPKASQSPPAEEFAKLSELLPPRRWGKGEVNELIARLRTSYTERELMQMTDTPNVLEMEVKGLGFEGLALFDITTALGKMWATVKQEEQRIAFLNDLGVLDKIEALKGSFANLGGTEDGAEIEIPLPCFLEPKNRFATRPNDDVDPQEVTGPRKILYRSGFERLRDAIIQYEKCTYEKPLYLHGPEGIGKSHALWWVAVDLWRQRLADKSKPRVLYLPYWTNNAKSLRKEFCLTYHDDDRVISELMNIPVEQFGFRTIRRPPDEKVFIIVDQAFDDDARTPGFVEPTAYFGSSVVLASSPRAGRQGRFFSDRSNLYLYQDPFSVKDVHNFLRIRGHISDTADQDIPSPELTSTKNSKKRKKEMDAQRPVDHHEPSEGATTSNQDERKTTMSTKRKKTAKADDVHWDMTNEEENTSNLTDAESSKLAAVSDEAGRPGQLISQSESTEEDTTEEDTDFTNAVMLLEDGPYDSIWTKHNVVRLWIAAGGVPLYVREIAAAVKKGQSVDDALFTWQNAFVGTVAGAHKGFARHLQQTRPYVAEEVVGDFVRCLEAVLHGGRFFLLLEDFEYADLRFVILEGDHQDIQTLRMRPLLPAVYGGVASFLRNHAKQRNTDKLNRVLALLTAVLDSGRVTASQGDFLKKEIFVLVMEALRKAKLTFGDNECVQSAGGDTVQLQYQFVEYVDDFGAASPATERFCDIRRLKQCVLCIPRAPNERWIDLVAYDFRAKRIIAFKVTSETPSSHKESLQFFGTDAWKAFITEKHDEWAKHMIWVLTKSYPRARFVPPTEATADVLQHQASYETFRRDNRNVTFTAEETGHRSHRSL